MQGSNGMRQWAFPSGDGRNVQEGSGSKDLLQTGQQEKQVVMGERRADRSVQRAMEEMSWKVQKCEHLQLAAQREVNGGVT